MSVGGEDPHGDWRACMMPYCCSVVQDRPAASTCLGPGTSRACEQAMRCPRSRRCFLAARGWLGLRCSSVRPGLLHVLYVSFEAHKPDVSPWRVCTNVQRHVAGTELLLHPRAVGKGRPLMWQQPHRRRRRYGGRACAGACCWRGRPETPGFLLTAKSCGGLPGEAHQRFAVRLYSGAACTARAASAWSSRWFALPCLPALAHLLPALAARHFLQQRRALEVSEAYPCDGEGQPGDCP